MIMEIIEMKPMNVCRFCVMCDIEQMCDVLLLL